VLSTGGVPIDQTKKLCHKEEGKRIRYTVDPDGQRLAVEQREFGDDLDGVTRMVVP